MVLPTPRWRAMYAHGVPRIDSVVHGIHVLFTGPPTWLVAPGGWVVQRRNSAGGGEEECVDLNQSALAQLRMAGERQLVDAIATLTAGQWPVPIGQLGTATGAACEVVTLAFDASQRVVHVTAHGTALFAFALSAGQVVAVSGAPVTGQLDWVGRATAIDAVVVYAQGLTWLRCCTEVPGTQLTWDTAPVIAERTLPLRELDPNLADADDEYAEARRRLLPGEPLDRDQFERLTDLLRRWVDWDPRRRPIEAALLVREDTNDPFEELTTLDPIRALVANAKWRRVLGLEILDDDPSLVPGQTYEYRVVGRFPPSVSRYYGFHTLPSRTELPDDFYLDDVRVRLPEPREVTVHEVQGTPRVRRGRRGIELSPRQDLSWLWRWLHDQSLVLDFPVPFVGLTLDLAPQHRLEVRAVTVGGGPTQYQPVAAQTPVTVWFPQPTQQVWFRGQGTLYGFWPHATPPAGQVPDWDERTMVLTPILFADAPRPEPPTRLTIDNLQQTPKIASVTQPAPRHALGFALRWRPATLSGLAVWPPDAPAPPLPAAIYQLEHQQIPSLTERLDPEALAEILVAEGRVAKADYVAVRDALVLGDSAEVAKLLRPTAWQPVLPEENWTLGDRAVAGTRPSLHPGVDVLEVFPEATPPGPTGYDVGLQDVFDFLEDDTRPTPPPGSLHQYRVRALDVVGRPGPSWRTSNVERLEKRAPPPQPVGPDETAAADRADVEPVGVQARVMVAGDPDLTPTEKATLGTHANVIELRWGWHEKQREQDEYCTEFRVYVSRRSPDAVRVQVDSVTDLGSGRYRLSIRPDRTLPAKVAVGAFLDAGYPFTVEAHGTTWPSTSMDVRAYVSGQRPKTGTSWLRTGLQPQWTRPKFWERVASVPVTAATAYSYTLADHLVLNPSQPEDEIWVGVSAADSQAYVADQLAPKANRPGNECAVVPVRCHGRHHGRPTLAPKVFLLDPPVVLTPEPSGGAIRFELDLTPHLAGTGLSKGTSVHVGRVSAESVLAAFVVEGTQLKARNLDDRQPATVTLALPANLAPSERTALRAAVANGTISGLDDRFLLFLASAHPFGDRLFEPISPDPVPLAPFSVRLPRTPSRYLFQMKRVDAARRSSKVGVVIPAVVRVPDPAPGAPPERIDSLASDPAGAVRLRVHDASVRHVLGFARPVVGATTGSPAAVLRVPNRPDLYPDKGIQLSTDDGALVPPTAQKSLDAADVVVAADGSRSFVLPLKGAAGADYQVWACALTRDAFPSALAGPWHVALPPSNATPPVLSSKALSDGRLFSWKWSTPDQHPVSLEAAPPGEAFTRVSPILPAHTAQHHYRATAAEAGWRYRVRVHAPGDAAYSNEVT